MMRTINRRESLQLVGGVLAWPVVTGMATAIGAGEDAAKPRIKIGQIGVGHAHANKLSVYRASADYEVVGIVEPDAKLRQQAETQGAYKDLPWMTREQLLNVPRLQAVLVETRVRDLLDNAETCIAAGKHIHLDKPDGESLLQFRRILDAAAKQKLLVQMGYMYRYNPAVVLLREFFKRGWLGEVCGTEGTFHIQPLDNPSARVALSQPRDSYKRGYQDISFPKYTRYVDDAADMAHVLRGEKPTDFPYNHDLTVQTALLQACGLPLDR